MKSTGDRQISRVAVVGAGRMGMSIGRRLAAIGKHVSIVDIDPRQREIAAAFAESTAARWDAGMEVDVVMTVLPSVGTFEAAAFGQAGLCAQIGADVLWVDLTSNDPRVARRAADSRAPGRFLGAPMGGGPGDAERGTLSFWVGGPRETQREAAELLAALASPTGVHDAGGEVTDGYLLKLLFNALWFGQVAAVSEALAVARRAGIPSDVFATLLAASPARSAFTDSYLHRLLAQDYVTDFGLAACVEELDVVHTLAEEAGVRVPTLDASLDIHHRALERYGAVDGEMMGARIALDQV